MRMVSRSVKWKMAAVGYVVIMGLFGPHAEAAFRLERADGHRPANGIAAQNVVWDSWKLPAPAKPVQARSIQQAAPQTGSGGCGGSLPTCRVMACESGGDLTVRNKEGSSASGKWQITRGSWAGHGGYAEARDAPESVQDDRARQLWADSHQHWEQCL